MKFLMAYNLNHEWFEWKLVNKFLSDIKLLLKYILNTNSRKLYFFQNILRSGFLHISTLEVLVFEKVFTFKYETVHQIRATTHDVKEIIFRHRSLNIYIRLNHQVLYGGTI